MTFYSFFSASSYILFIGSLIINCYLHTLKIDSVGCEKTVILIGSVWQPSNSQDLIGLFLYYRCRCAKNGAFVISMFVVSLPNTVLNTFQQERASYPKT